MVSNTNTNNQYMFQQKPRKTVLSRFNFRQIYLLVALLGVPFASLAFTLLSPQTTSATVSSTVNFQAKLQTSGGAIVADGNYNVEFKLYDASSSSGSSQGSCSGDSHCLWVETRISTDQVRVANGYITVNLGSVTAFGTINWNQQLWLTMNIGGTGSPSWDGEMNPRIQLTATPYAFQAGELGNGTNRATFDSSGNLQFQQASTVKELSAATGTQLTIQGGAATTGTNVGGNLLLQGGAGASTGASGSVVVQSNTNNSTTAFQVQNASSAPILTVDTSNAKVVLGQTGGSGLNGQLVFNSATASNYTTTIVASSSQAASYSLTLPTSGPAINQCLKTDPSTATQLLFGSCGSGTTLAAAYTAGTSQTDSTLSLDATRLGVILKDASSPISGSLLTIQNNGGTTKYLDVSASSVAIKGSTGTTQTVANGGVTIQTNTDSTTALQIQNAAGVNFINASTSTLAATVNQGNLVVTDLSAPTSPGVAAGANTGGTLSGAAATTYYYKITALNAAGESITSSEVSINGQSFTKITDNSSSLTATASGTAGNVSCNNTAGQGCKYKVTFVTANGESLGDAGSTSLLNVTTKQINLTNIPTSPSAAVTSRKIYRSTNGGAYLLDQTIANNTATTATDNVTTPAGAYPSSSTATTNTNNASVSWTAVTNATSYRIYRGTSSGGENAYQTSASSPFTDTGAAGTSQAMPTRSTVSQLGIGTSAPSANLDVEGNALFKNVQNTTTGLQVQNAGGTTIFDVDTSNSRIGINTTSPQQTIDGWNAANSATYSEVARFVVTNNAGGTNYSRLLFGQNTTNAMFIEAADQSNTKGTLLLQPFGGSVVVGGTSASYQFQVQGSVCLGCGNASVVTIGTQDSTNEGAELDLLGPGSYGTVIFDHYQYLQRTYWNNANTGNTNQFQIFNASTGTAGLYVQGNVGIGSSGPSYPLDVTGIIRSSSGVIATGDDNGGSGGQIRMISGNYGTFWRNDGSNLYLLQTTSGNQYGTWNSNRQIIAPMNSDNIYFSNNGGGVGIGTTSIGHTLTVSKTNSGGKVVGFNNFTGTDSSATGILELRGGWASGSAANSRYIQFYDSATTDTNGIGEGSVISRAGGVTYNNVNADFGEYFDLNGPIQYGDIAAGAWVNGTYVAQQATSLNSNLIGVMSEKTGFAGNSRYLADGSIDTNHRDTIGFLGQIATHVSNINGAIHAGDPIGLSAIPGYGAKAVGAGQIIGRAMEDFDPSSGSATSACPSGTTAGLACGRIMVLVNPSWYDPSTDMAGNLQGASFASLNITGDLNAYHLVVTSDATFKANIIVEGHVITGGDAPVADPQVAAGTDLTGHVDGACTINGNDTSGAISLVAGTSNLASGAQCTITFAKPFGGAPRPLLSATNKEAAGVGLYAQTSPTQMTIYFSHTPEAGHQYDFNYWNPQ